MCWTIYALILCIARFPLSLFHSGVPFLLVMIVLLARPDILGTAEDSPWCFIGRNQPVWRFVTVYGLLAVCWMLTSLFYFLASRKFNLMRTISFHGPSDTHEIKRKQEELAEVRMKLTSIPIIFVLLRVCGLVYRILAAAYPDETHVSTRWFWLALATAIGEPAQGITDCIVFVFLAKKVRRRYYTMFLKCIGRAQGGETDPLVGALDGHTPGKSIRGDDRLNPFDHHNPRSPAVHKVMAAHIGSDDGEI